MKKFKSAALVLALLLFTTACASAAGSVGQGGSPSAASVAEADHTASTGASASQAEAAVTSEKSILRILLPSRQRALEEILLQAAAAEQIQLQIDTELAGDSYAEAATQALAGGSPPDLFYLHNAADAQAVAQTGSLLDLSSAGALPAMRSLAALVPAETRLVNPAKVYGLPLGTSAQGYIVNLDLLAALLDAPNKATLLADLQACTWQQWQTLATTIQSYLPSPQRTVVQLGYNSYTMPRSRPAVAQPLRGIFAVADNQPAALTTGLLEAAVTAAFESYGELVSLSDTQKASRLYGAFEGVFALLELETRYMAREDGVLRHGERYGVAEKLSQSAANQLFVGRAALFLRGDSQLALQLEQENPQLQGSLALIPAKMPPHPQVEEAEDNSATSSEADESAATEEPALPAADLSERIAAQNTALLCSVGGTLCVNPDSPNAEAAQNLLLRLFTGDEGRQAIRDQLGLQPFSTPVPSGSLHAQLADAVAAGANVAVPWPVGLSSAGESLGAYVQTNLLEAEDWTAEARAAFAIAGAEALGIVIRE